MFLDNYWWSLTACAAHKNTISLWIAVLFLQLNRCHVVDDKDNFGHTPCLCPFFFQRQNSLKVIIVVMPGRGANNKFWLRGLWAIWPALTLKSDSYCVIWCCHHVVALRMFPLFFVQEIATHAFYPRHHASSTHENLKWTWSMMLLVANATPWHGFMILDVRLPQCFWYVTSSYFSLF